MPKAAHKVVVIGHRNPDTDSICSAIAYAELKNKTSDLVCEPRRAGKMNQETEFVLKKFGVKPPRMCTDVNPKIRDVDYREMPGIPGSTSLRKAWEIMRDQQIDTLPNTSADNELEGIITVKDIATANMDVFDTGVLATSRTTYKNILETLGGTMVVGNENAVCTTGHIKIGTATPEMLESNVEKGDIVILTNRYESQLCAIEKEASLLIICNGAKVGRTIQRIAEETGVAIMTAPCDTYAAGKLVSQCAPISYYMTRNDIVKFTLVTPVADVTRVMAKVRHRYFPILDEDGKYKPASVITGYTHAPEFIHFFPRMWDARKGEKEYKQWAAYRTKTEIMRDEKGEIVRDSQGRPMQGEVLDFGTKKVYDDGYEPRTIVEPTFLENLNYFFNYQLSYMYWRYFLWNFVGRQSDIQPTRVTITDGNWLSGIKWIDEKYLGPQDDLPREIADNKGRNTYYFLPFLLGLIGLIYQLNRDQRNFSIVMWLFIMTGIALVFYFNTSPGEPRERDYVYAGSFYAFCIWIGFGVLAIRDLVAWLTRRNNVTAAVAATVVCMGVPTILAAQNWDDHDRSHRYMARDIGWNYLMSTLPNSIILNYGDNDTFPLWNNQEIYGVRPDVRIMNTSYLGGEWYIDEMKTKANDAPGVPFSLPKSKYTFTNDWVPVDNRFDRAVDIKDVIEFVRSEDPRSKIKLSDGTMTDYIPTKRIALPVNKENAIASGIVAEKDRAQMVDTVYINLRKNSIDKTQLMILDMLANFDWKRPLYMTQVYILQDFGLMDYLQFDGYAYRFVPILTPVQNPWEIGRIDADYAAPLLKETFRYGNLADPRVYADYFIQYNLSASHARDAFARVAKELLRQDRAQEAVELLDMGLEKLPPSQIRFTDSNTYPFLEAYYAASAMGVEDAADKGDALLREYARTLIEYIEYYLRFDGVQGDMVSPIIDEKLDQLGDVYYLAVYAGRKEIIGEINAYYRSLGVEEENLVDVGDKPHQVDTTLIPRKDTAQ